MIAVTPHLFTAPLKERTIKKVKQAPQISLRNRHPSLRIGALPLPNAPNYRTPSLLFRLAWHRSEGAGTSLFVVLTPVSCPIPSPWR
jgi:hypothetical protein